MLDKVGIDIDVDGMDFIGYLRFWRVPLVSESGGGVKAEKIIFSFE